MRQFFYVFGLLLLFSQCVSQQSLDEPFLMTVTGKIGANELGRTLEHEHVVVDFIGAEKVEQPQYNMQVALDTLLPYFSKLKDMGVQTIMECTPNYIGRDVRLLKEISEQTGLQILTNTGYYAAANKKYLPAHSYTESAEFLTKKWISEWENGIDGTEIRPGFIKLGVGKEHLDSVEQKIVRAGAMTHLETGLKIAIHTGGAAPANDEVDILEREGVAPEALIVVHSQNMSSEDQIKIMRRGAWVSLDGVKDNPQVISKYLAFLLAIKKVGLLDQTLISQDAYWSVLSEDGTVGFKRFGSPYTAILDVLVPKLLENGFTQEEIDQLLITNPAKAYTIEVCKL